MKKIFISLVMCIVMGFGCAFAQVMPAKFFDNTTITLKGGVSTPLNDFGTVDFEKVGVEVEKGITPWLSVVADGNFYIGENINTYTAFDYVNVNGLVKFNLINLFGKFNGTRRTFEPSVFTGIGWGHRTASRVDLGLRNFMTYKAGAEIEFNLGKEKAWSLKLQPAVVWACPTSGKLSKRNGEFELNVGVAYHFRNHDRNRTFTLVRPYDQNEIDNLNNQINGLRDENECLRSRLSSIATTVKETIVNNIVVDTVMMMPRTQFYLNSSRLVETSLGNVQDMAQYIKSNPNKHYNIVGYASIEGSESYNLDLSKRRAEALYDKLVEYGVNPDQLTVEARGATEKFSDESRELNRVVIVEEN